MRTVLWPMQLMHRKRMYYTLHAKKTGGQTHYAPCSCIISYLVQAIRPSKSDLLIEEYKDPGPRISTVLGGVGGPWGQESYLRHLPLVGRWAQTCHCKSVLAGDINNCINTGLYFTGYNCDQLHHGNHWIPCCIAMLWTLHTEVSKRS